MRHHIKVLFSLLSCSLCLTFSATAAFPDYCDQIDLDHGSRYHDYQDQTLGCEIVLDADQILFTFGFKQEGLPPRGVRCDLLGGEIDPSPLYLQPCDT